MRECLELHELMRMAKHEESILARIYRKAWDNACSPSLRKLLLDRQRLCEEGEGQLSEWIGVLGSCLEENETEALPCGSGDPRPSSPLIGHCFPAE